jgi:hypothetical protein
MEYKQVGRREEETEYQQRLEGLGTGNEAWLHTVHDD